MKKRFLSIIFAIMLICTLFAGCKEDTHTVKAMSPTMPYPKSILEITGDGNTRYLYHVATVKVEDGDVIGNIDLGDYNNHWRFLGWYTDESYTYQWNTATDEVHSDLTLYAKWEEIDE